MSSSVMPVRRACCHHEDGCWHARQVELRLQATQVHDKHRSSFINLLHAFQSTDQHIRCVSKNGYRSVMAKADCHL